MRSRRSRIGGLATMTLVVLALVVVTLIESPLSMAGSVHAALPLASRDSGGYVWRVLTPGPERIALELAPQGEVLLEGRSQASSRGTDANRRQLFIRQGAPMSPNQTVCATWLKESRASVQQGLAARVRGGRAGRVRAITLTKNTYANYFWVFNVLTWDTRRPGVPWRPVGQFDMSEVVVRDGHWVPFPWRICLRVRGQAAEFKLWLPNEEPEPRWRDPLHARRVRLPEHVVARGRPGWYVGHLPAGQTTVYTDLSP